MHTTPESYQESVRRLISENASLNTPYLVMNGLATIVASYGLLEDSTAVVIGAMVIAMLLGPITGISLGLVDGRGPLLRRALLAESSGALLVMVIAFIFGLVHHDIPAGREILSRTAPNLLDLIIALAGGAAGAYATISPHLSIGLVGVAIATALVPPLATCSILLARGESQLAFGAFLLFFTNFVAIQCASSMVLILSGYHRLTHWSRDEESLLLRHTLSFGLLTFLAVVLGIHLSQTLGKRRFEATVQQQLDAALDAYAGAYLSEVRFDPTPTLTPLW